MDNLIPYITQGVQEDCETLLIKYERLKSVRFTEFAKVWQEMKFTAIYSDRNLTEIDIFVAEILLMVKQFFIKATSFNLKVGALYLLYGLYYKQPLKNYKKIHITMSDWEIIDVFIKELRENNHFDTLIIINRLIADNAFVYSPVSSTRKNVVPEQYFRFGLFHTNSLIEDMELDNAFKELKDIEEKYVEAKNLVSGKVFIDIQVLRFSENDFLFYLLANGIEI